jgi:hypothetical protein
MAKDLASEILRLCGEVGDLSFSVCGDAATTEEAQLASARRMGMIRHMAGAAICIPADVHAHHPDCAVS